MRIINASENARKLAGLEKRKARRRLIRRISLIVFFLFLGIGGWIYMGRSESEITEVASTQTAETTIEPPPRVRQLRTFDGEGFRALYLNFAYPDTSPAEVLPEISGIPEVDQRIQDIARSRGYKSQPEALEASLVPLPDGQLIQQRVLEPLQKLQALALANGLDLRVASAYRSSGDQRFLFTTRLLEQGVGIESTDFILEGLADPYLQTVMTTTAPPGFSRHHTGYAVDFQCAESGLEFFESSPCFGFLSANNFLVVKELGFVPSYPAGASLQGPEPESWEYIWLGKEALLD